MFVGIRRNEDVSVIKHMIFYSQKAMEMEKFFVVIARWYGAVKLDRIMAAFSFRPASSGTWTSLLLNKVAD